MREYFSLLQQKRFDEAEKVRKESIPHKLTKFIPLSDDEDSNAKRFFTLRNKQLWFSSVDTLNDPYEFQCMYIREDILQEKNYPQKIIDYFKDLLGRNMRNWVLVSLSANTYNCLPMWAYYTNNYRGFCVEYEVVSPDYIHKIWYEPDRIPLAGTVAEYVRRVEELNACGKKAEAETEAEFYTEILFQQFFLKHKSWEHENEYRMVYPMGEPKGINIDLEKIGLRTSRIIAGLNCKKAHIDELSLISHSLGCGEVSKVKISEKNYTLLEEA